MVKNAYIHIPFCKSKCKYCSFVSYESLEYMDEYFESLSDEINQLYKGETLETLYFGGGTPSVCSSNNLEKILKLFKSQASTEVTIEVNPDDASEEYLRELYKIGFNRISFGVQSFDDEILKTIGRRHDSKTAEKVVKLAKKVGFKNVSIDLIYGLPTQNLDFFKFDLERVLELEVQHVSFYGLKIEKGCFFAKNMPKNLPDLDLQADMYEFCCEFLVKNGFNHYEISNFAKSNFSSCHNLNYWKNNSYYGFGVAAHGFDGNFRYENEKSIQEYIKNPFKKENISKISIKQSLEEEIFLGLRMMDGINVVEIGEKFNIDFNKKYENILDKYRDFFKKTDEGYSLTTQGFLISNEILLEFLI